MAKSNIPDIGAVVGTIHSPRSLAAAQALRAGDVDFLELRVDAFAALPEGAVELGRLQTAASRLPAPLIVTVRHPQEGGAGQLSSTQRQTLFRQFFSYASFIDVELRSVRQLEELLAEARSQGIGTILSHHDFRTTPALTRLHELAWQVQDLKGGIFKVATMARTPQALAVLLEFLTGPPHSRGARGAKPALSVMGMGEFGMISRLVLGRAGSVLNYGYLDTAQVPGQWPAELLKQRLLELGNLKGPTRAKTGKPR